MAITSTTVGGINCWKFSGTVTDAEIISAWSGLITDERYTIGRAIFLDSDCDISGLLGGYHVDIGPQSSSIPQAFILHTSRTVADCIFAGWNFIQTVSMTVANRGQMVKGWNGSTLTGTEGLAMDGGSFIYAVEGGTTGGGGRYLNEMRFESLEGGVQISSNAFTVQELQPVYVGTGEMKGVVFKRCYGFPQVETGSAKVVIYRSSQDTGHATQSQIRAFSDSNVCYIDSIIRRNTAAVTSNLSDFYNSSGDMTCMFLNNWKDESFFGAAKTSIVAGNWNSGNQYVGGVLRKYKAQDLTGVALQSMRIRCYDSRSVTASQKNEFVGTASIDFLGANVYADTDVNGEASVVNIGGIATGSSPPSITRYSGQVTTFQKFGQLVISQTVLDMESGDNDLSAFSPVVFTSALYLVRSEATINLATEVNSFLQVAEEIHNLAIGQVGDGAYNGQFLGNLQEVSGSTLNLGTSDLGLDSAASPKIAYNKTTKAIAIKSTTLVASAIMTLQSTGTLTTNSLIPSGMIFDCDIVYDVGAATTLTNITANQVIDFTTAGTYTNDGGTLNEVTNSSGGAVIINNINGGTVTTNTGPSITLEQNINISNSTILDDSTVLLYNVTKDLELDYSTVSGGLGYSFDVNLLGALVDEDDVIRLQAALYRTDGTIYIPLEQSSTVGVTSVSFVGSQSAWPVLQSIHAKGTTYEGANVTGFTLDVGNIEIDSSLTEISGWMLATWAYYQIATTGDGIRNYFQSFISLNLQNFQIDSSKVDLKIDNTGSPATWVDASWTRSDGASIVAATSVTIQFANGLINVVSAQSTVDELVYAIWDEATVDHSDTGTFGQTVKDINTNVSALNDFDPSVDVVANVTLVDTTTTNTDNAELKANQTTINDGVKSSSLLIPHSTDLPNT